MSKLPIDPGKLRGLSRILSADGFFLMSAIDHLDDFAKLLPTNGAKPSFEQVVRAKERIARVLAEESSAVLLDPEYGLGHVAPAGAIPANTGLVASIEGDDYEVRYAERTTTIRPGWSVAKAKRAGADAAKLLWYYRPDGNQILRESQLDVLRSFIRHCDENSLLSIVEPIWSPLPGENMASPQWRSDRVRGIIQSAIEVDRLGADILKVEFPGDVETQSGRQLAAEACEALDAGVKAPWVILSAGVGFDDFATQVEIASRAGASGYLAGRSLWREAAAAHTDSEFSEGVSHTRQRLQTLNDITNRLGRPVQVKRPLDAILASVPHGWYLEWNDNIVSSLPSK